MNLLKCNPFLWRFLTVALIAVPLQFHANASNKIQKLKDGLGQSSNDIFELGANIRTLEKKLGNKNEEYLTQLENIKKLDQFIAKIREKIGENSQQLQSETERVTRAYEELLLNEMQQQTEEHLLKRKLLQQILVSEAENLQKIKDKNQKLLKLLDNYENELLALKENERSVYDLIVSMENQKKNLSKTYLDKLAVKNQMEQKLEIEVARSRAVAPKIRPATVTNKFPLALGLPLAEYSKVKESKKGVTLSYQGVQPIQASGNGKVVYLGTLASYGNVLIIDHGQDIRSVILGDFRAKVQKGEELTKGTLIGYTNSESGITKSLYYEIRKHNTAQNTFSILKTNKVL